jgi:hypothetical protein
MKVLGGTTQNQDAISQTYGSFRPRQAMGLPFPVHDWPSFLPLTPLITHGSWRQTRLARTRG